MVTIQPLAHRYTEIAIKTATPLQVVVMLYDGAIHSLREAQEHIRRKDIASRARSINRAVGIISELQASLNFNIGGQIAESLDRLYTYMKDRVFTGNTDQKAEPLAEVVSLLENLRSAWAELATQAPTKSQPASAPPLPDTGVLKTATSGAVEQNSLNICG